MTRSSSSSCTCYCQPLPSDSIPYVSRGKKNHVKEFWTTLQSVIPLCNSTMYTFENPIRKKPSVLFIPVISKLFKDKSILLEHLDTNDVRFGKQHTDSKLHEGRENLLVIFAHSQHNTQETMLNKQLLTGFM